MRQIAALAVTAAVAAGLGACQSWPPPSRSAERVSEGMNEVEVVAALGAPTDIYATSTSERWAYCLPGALFDDYVAVDFQGGKVAKASGALELAYGACEMALEPGKGGSASSN
ncbi:MAG: hypothetical protein ACR2RL_18475 [Gammaproteobacteria bacterium]